MVEQINKKSEKFEQEFVDVYLRNSMHGEVDTLSAELYVRLYLEPEDISMDDLAKKSGYSLSAVSGKLKMLESIGVIQKIKKPGTKKLFFHAEKNLGMSAIKKMSTYLQNEIIPLKQNLPAVLEKYALDEKKSKNEHFKKQYAILKDYVIQLDFTEKSIRASIEHISKLMEEHCKNSKV